MFRGFIAENLRRHVGFWPIASVRCDAEFGPLSGHSGFRQADRPADLWVHGLVKQRSALALAGTIYRVGESKVPTSQPRECHWQKAIWSPKRAQNSPLSSGPPDAQDAVQHLRVRGRARTIVALAASALFSSASILDDGSIHSSPRVMINWIQVYERRLVTGSAKGVSPMTPPPDLLTSPRAACLSLPDRGTDHQ
jgi:hypothetical protein